MPYRFVGKQTRDVDRAYIGETMRWNWWRDPGMQAGHTSGYRWPRFWNTWINNVIVLDTCESVRVNIIDDITEYPTEKGSIISDHVHNRPEVVEIEAKYKYVAPFWPNNGDAEVIRLLNQWRRWRRLLVFYYPGPKQITHWTAPYIVKEWIIESDARSMDLTTARISLQRVNITERYYLNVTMADSANVRQTVNAGVQSPAESTAGISLPYGGKKTPLAV